MITIRIYNLLNPEKFEDELRDFLESKKLIATIENEVTGNTTQTRDKKK